MRREWQAAFSAWDWNDIKMVFNLTIHEDLFEVPYNGKNQSDIR
jgi:hypothetical protein